MRCESNKVYLYQHLTVVGVIEVANVLRNRNLLAAVQGDGVFQKAAQRQYRRPRGRLPARWRVVQRQRQRRKATANTLHQWSPFGEARHH